MPRCRHFDRTKDDRVARGWPEVTSDSLLLFMGGFFPGLGQGTAGSLVMLAYPDIAETTDRSSLDYSPGTLVKP
jgi:hypothetical protein